jgi:hypothetical protein
MNYLNPQKYVDGLLNMKLSEGEQKLSASIAAVLRTHDHEEVIQALAAAITVYAVAPKEQALKS